MATSDKTTTSKKKSQGTPYKSGAQKPPTAAKTTSGTKSTTAKGGAKTTTAGKGSVSTKSGGTTKPSGTTKSGSTSTKSGSTAKPTSGRKKSSSKSATDTAKDKLSSATSAAKNNPGKVLAAAGVAAATAAGYAVYRATRGSGSNDSDGRSVYHILPEKDGWQIKGEGASRAVSKHDTKKGALSAARDLAHNQVPSQLVVHKSDGTIQESWSYDAEN